MVNLFSKVYNRDLIGIDIGSDTIKIVEGYFDSNTVHVKNFTMVKTPKDSYSSGKVLEPKKISEAINSAIRESSMESRNIVYVIDGPDIVNRHIEVPTIDKKEVKKMLDFEIPQQLPIAMDENIVQRKVVGRINEEEIKKTEILVVAVRRETVDAYLAISKGLGREAYALDTAFSGIDKLFHNDIYLNYKDDVSDKTVAMIDIGHSTININIYDKGKFIFDRIINQGSKYLDQNIANFFGLNFKEAEEKKKSIPNINEEYLEEDNQAEGSLLNTAVKSTIDGWTNEINKVFKYFSSRSFENNIDHIYIYGGGSKINGLDGYFENFFDIRTSKLSNINRISDETEDKGIEQDVYLNAISSLIRLD